MTHPWFPSGPETPYQQLVRELTAGLTQMRRAEHEAGSRQMHEIMCVRCLEKGEGTPWVDYGLVPEQLVGNLARHIRKHHPEALLDEPSP